SPDAFFPGYTGPQQATETPHDVMASPDSVGTTLEDASGLTQLGERDAVTLAFNDSGRTVQEAALTPQTVSLPSVPYITSAATLGNLPALAVPNTLLDPTAHDFGKIFDVTALAIDGTLSTPTEEDYYAFHGTRGQVMNFQVISINKTRNPNPIVSELLL